MTRSQLAISALTLTLGCQLLARPEQAPEDFATTALRAVAMNDFGAYLPLCARDASGAALQGGKALSSSLDPLETEQIRQEFDRVVRSNRLRAHAVDIYQPRLSAREHDRWVFEVVDGSAQAVGVQLVIRRVGSNYQLVTLNLL